MIAHYLAVALAKFAKSPFTTAANVLTLALGLACFVAAWGIADWWRSADGYRRDSDRIVAVGQSVSAQGESAARRFNPTSTHTIARYLAEDEPELVAVARMLPLPGVVVAAGDRKAALGAMYVDPAFLKIFDFDFLEGRAADALSAPGSVVLGADAAARLFGDAPALGRTVRVDDAWDGVVTGVVAPVRQPSFLGGGRDGDIQVNVIAPWSSNPGAVALDAQDVWNRSDVFTFALLPRSLTVRAFDARLAAFLDRRAPPESRAGADIRLTAYPIGELTTRRLDSMLFARSGLHLPATVALLALGALTLGVACVNYANLAFAQAATRSKEIGMRRVLGAGRLQVMAQSWLEALLLAGLSLALALGGLALATPAARAWTGVDVLHVFARGLTPVAAMLGLMGLVALVAGAYPALASSRVRPAQAIAAGRARLGARGVMRLLVGAQFASASFLLILVVVTQLQRVHLEHAAIDARSDPVIVLGDVSRLGVDDDLLADRLSRAPGVRSVSFSDREPWSVGRLVLGYARSPDPGDAAPPSYLKVVRPGYFETLQLPVLAGRVFDAAHETGPGWFLTDDPDDPREMVVDRALAARLGFATPEAAVGQTVYVPDSFTPPDVPALPVRIIGVVETEVTRLESSDVAGHAYVYTPWRGGAAGVYPMIRVAPGEADAAAAAVSHAWDELAPGAPVDIRFLDDLFERSFRAYARVGQIFTLLAAAAFVIATIGQLGLAVHVAARRRHEIGVRKTLGATTLGIVRLLLIDFSKPALLANLLAWPLAYFAAETYLSAFADRVALTPAPFALSMGVTFAIACAAAIGEVAKAASVRPAEVLRQA